MSHKRQPTSEELEIEYGYITERLFGTHPGQEDYANDAIYRDQFDEVDHRWANHYEVRAAPFL